MLNAERRAGCKREAERHGAAPAPVKAAGMLGTCNKCPQSRAALWCLGGAEWRHNRELAS